MNTIFILLSFIFFSLFSSSFSADVIHDIAGNELRTGVSYYILPVIRGNGGGVSLFSNKNKPCPLDVVQEQLEVNNGLPVTFAPFNSKHGVIPLSTDLNIEFFAATICIQSTVWRLENTNGKMIVSTGGIRGNPGGDTVGNWFKIEKYRDDYKLVFCPSVCNTCRPVCGHIGISTVNRIRHLALSDVPFWVMFKRA